MCIRDRRTVVIVEDIVDTGLTMQRLLETLGTRNPESIHIASLLVKPCLLYTSRCVEETGVLADCIAVRIILFGCISVYQVCGLFSAMMTAPSCKGVFLKNIFSIRSAVTLALKITRKKKMNLLTKKLIKKKKKKNRNNEVIPIFAAYH